MTKKSQKEEKIRADKIEELAVRLHKVAAEYRGVVSAQDVGSILIVLGTRGLLYTAPCLDEGVEVAQNAFTQALVAQIKENMEKENG